MFCLTECFREPRFSLLITTNEFISVLRIGCLHNVTNTLFYYLIYYILYYLQSIPYLTVILQVHSTCVIFLTEDEILNDFNAR